MTESTHARWLERHLPVTTLPPTTIKGKAEALTLHRLEWDAP